MSRRIAEGRSSRDECNRVQFILLFLFAPPLDGEDNQGGRLCEQSMEGTRASTSRNKVPSNVACCRRDQPNTPCSLRLFSSSSSPPNPFPTSPLPLSNRTSPPPSSSSRIPTRSFASPPATPS